ncbi:MAG TPA: aminotransferase class V-fold PLP-dependent enzyme [Candidatus Edwardsbacteria bacterium]|nr:aminotransferase class V-fold PLP-dependent enzyme [Candidatus Edwardsbacteria bacterium]
MIYLDNASTSFPKPENVYREMDRCLRRYCANPGRGGHAMAKAAGEAVFRTRTLLAAFFNIDRPERVIFTKNTTEALNIAIRGTLKHGDHVVTTSLEHNSVMRPLKHLARERGIAISVVRGDAFGTISARAVERKIRGNTALIVCTLSSNVNGAIMPTGEIGAVARRHGITFLADAAQGAGTIPVDVQDLGIDLLAFPGHKSLLGPQGTGGLYVGQGIKVAPLMQGGTGTTSEIPYQPTAFPEALECGTLNTPGIVGLGAAIEYISRRGVSAIYRHKQALTDEMHRAFAKHRAITLYSRPEHNTGIVALNIKGLTSAEAGRRLDQKHGIAARAGLHCAPFGHRTLGYDLATGVLRLSVGCFTTADEVARTIKAVLGLCR